jgi:hypothetical protein
VNNFSELTDKELVALSQEDIGRFIKFRLMEEGVISPTEPVVVEVEEVSEEPSEFYCLKLGGNDLIFSDIDEAKNALELLKSLKVFESAYEFSVGYDHRFAKPINEISITSVSLWTPSQFAFLKEKLAGIEQAKKHNKAEQERYKKETDAQSYIVEEVWDCINDARARIGEIERTLLVWDDYLSTCDGDTETALKFLRKAVNEEQISKAVEYFPESKLSTAVNREAMARDVEKAKDNPPDIVHKDDWEGYA